MELIKNEEIFKNIYQIEIAVQVITMPKLKLPEHFNKL